MVVKTVVGNVLCDSNVVGNYSIQYDDKKENAYSENSESKNIVDDVICDSSVVGQLNTASYIDLITHDGGGSRNISLSGDVTVLPLNLIFDETSLDYGVLL